MGRLEPPRGLQGELKGKKKVRAKWWSCNCQSDSDSHSSGQLAMAPLTHRKHRRSHRPRCRTVKNQPCPTPTGSSKIALRVVILHRRRDSASA